MRCLIDSDILKYEVGFAAQTATGDEQPLWPVVEEMLEQRIQHIEYECNSTKPSVMYFTGKENFRNAIAKRTPYKQRAGAKPYHFSNIGRYLKCNYLFREEDGLEADDLLAIDGTEDPDSVVCTRDKDLKTVPNINVFSWELKNQPSFGPSRIDEVGNLSFEDGSIKGTGDLFFYAQCLMGDPTDSIPGIPKIGKKKAFDALKEIKCKEKAFEVVIDMYRNYFGDLADQELLEQARLLYMIRVRKGNKILFWNPPNTTYEDWYDLDSRTIERIDKV